MAAGLPRRLGRAAPAADDPLDLASPQGRVTAYDRAWQIEVERHRAQGTSGGLPRPRRARLGPLRPARPARRHRPPLLRRPGPGHRGVGRRVRRRGQRRARRRGRRRTGVRRHRRCARAGGSPGRRWRSGWPPHPLRRVPRQAVARARGPHASAPTAVDLFAADGPGRLRQQRLAAARGPHRHRGRADRRRPAPASSRTPASTSRSGWPARSSTWSGSPSPACPGIAALRPHRRRWPGRSPTRWPTTRTCTASGCAATATGCEALGPDGWRPAARHVETIEVRRRRAGRGRGDRDRPRTGDRPADRRRPATAHQPALPAPGPRRPRLRGAAAAAARPHRRRRGPRASTAGSSRSTSCWPPTPTGGAAAPGRRAGAGARTGQRRRGSVPGLGAGPRLAGLARAAAPRRRSTARR